MSEPCKSLLSSRLEEYRNRGILRELPTVTTDQFQIDFTSNDYLSIARRGLLHHECSDARGSTGSRLLSGNSALAEEVEHTLATFHEASAGLIFNSGYDANIGVLSALPSRHDVVLYDELCHASMRDGVRLSLAKSYSFRHNDLDDLEKKLKRTKRPGATQFVACESIYSMDGDSAPLQELHALVAHYDAWLIVDEAHATGMFGTDGAGLVQHHKIHDRVVARIHTFGKALGCHGAVVVGGALLRELLITSARSFIYTTALPPDSYAVVRQAYAVMKNGEHERRVVLELAARFSTLDFGDRVTVSRNVGPIQSIIIGSSSRARQCAQELRQRGFGVRAIVSPTVAKGTERIRICLHAHNSAQELDSLALAVRECS
jgi:8-amino-7-oxononanoate synthase